MRLSVALTAVAVAVCAAGAGRADPAFAGADTEPYYVAFLRPYSDAAVIEKGEEDRIQEAHLANIRKMAADGVLIAAGPMADAKATIRGVFILKAASMAEARRIVLRDPAVAARRNTVDVHAWSGPKGIGVGYFQWKKAHPDADDAMAVHAFCVLTHGPQWTGDPNSDGEHAVFVDSIRRAGVLAAAGNTDGDPDLYALCVFKTASVDEAKRIMDQDPVVQSGRVAVEFHRWWTADLVLPW